MPERSILSEQKGNPVKPSTPQLPTILPWIILGLGFLLWGIIVYHTRFQLEDALITYRYSANIVAGKGFVFNAGERVLGTTTPLVTLLLAFVSLPFGSHSVREVATVVMPVFGLMAGVAAYFALAGRGVSRAAAGLEMCLLYMHIELIRTGIGGMETPVVLLLMGLSLWALGNNRPVAVGILCGLLVLCRIDGGIWAALIVLALLFKSPRKAAISALTAFLTILPWVLFAFIYFGNCLPNSMLAKAVIRPGREGILLSSQHILKYALWYVNGTGFTKSLYLFPIWLLFLIFGARRLLQQDRRNLWPVVAFPIVYALTMYLGRSPRFEWYLLPITYTCMILLAVGIVDYYQKLERLIPSRARSPIAALITLILVANYCVTTVPVLIRRMSYLATREDCVRTAVGKWLKNNTPSSASVAMEAIGYQGYYSERRIVDMAGLVTPKVVEFKSSTGLNGQVFDDVLEYFKPDYIVLRSFEVDTNHHFNGGPLFLTSDKEQQFNGTYREIKRFNAPGADRQDLLCHITLYQRVTVRGGS